MLVIYANMYGVVDKERLQRVGVGFGQMPTGKGATDLANVHKLVFLIFIPVCFDYALYGDA